MAGSGENGARISARLKNAEVFLPIVSTDESGNPVRFYGGDQAWFGTRVGRYSGCGAVAAADVFAYLALQNPAYAPLFTADSPEISLERFREYMEAVIRYVAPGRIPFTDIPYGGLTSLSRFTRYCDVFLKSCGVPLKGRYFDGRELSLEQAAERIAGQLSRDNPVALLVMQNARLKCVSYTDAYGKPVTSDVRFHWMVITSIEQAAEKIEIVVSSEGGKVTLDFSDVWTCDSGSKVGWRGIVYFENR